MIPYRTRFHFTTLGALGATAALGLACSDAGPEASHRAGIAQLEPTSGHTATGTVRFDRLDAGGVRVVADVRGLERGEHAFHVHEVGDCGEDAAAAGPHFSFLGDEAVEPKRITGNLGELTASADGAARIEATVGAARLEGPNSIVGRAVVVHARGNDPTQPPDGAAGDRVACGVIEATDARMASAPAGNG